MSRENMMFRTKHSPSRVRQFCKGFLLQPGTQRKAGLKSVQVFLILILLWGVLFTSALRTAGQDGQLNPDNDFAETYRRNQEEIRRGEEDLRSLREYLWGWNEMAGNAVWSFYHPYLRGIDTHNIVVAPDVSTTEANVFNTYGAMFKVPNGSYSGNDIISSYELAIVPFGPYNKEIRSYAGSGWSFEPGNLLVQEILTVSARGTIDPFINPQFVDCGSVMRYRLVGPNGITYFQNQGLELLCNFRINGTNEPAVCFGSYEGSCPLPTQFWSTSGQIMLDVSNPQSPILRYPDGTVETMARQPQGNISLPFHAQRESMFDPISESNWRGPTYWATSKVQDRNGNQTAYNYDNQTGWLASVVDPQGRTTTY